MGGVVVADDAQLDVWVCFGGEFEGSSPIRLGCDPAAWIWGFIVDVEHNHGRGLSEPGRGAADTFDPFPRLLADPGARVFAHQALHGYCC